MDDYDLGYEHGYEVGTKEAYARGLEDAARLIDEMQTAANGDVVAAKIRALKEKK